MPIIKDVIQSLAKIEQIHRKKNDDYATGSNPFSNFDLAIPVLSAFSSDRDKVYVWPIAVKLARLGVLLSNNRPPNNESVEDSLIDIATYVLIWKADIVRRKEELETTGQIDIIEEIFGVPYEGKIETELGHSNDFFDILKIMPDSQLNELLAFAEKLLAARKLNLGRKGRPFENVKKTDPGNAYPKNRDDIRIQTEPEYSKDGREKGIDKDYADDNKKDSPDHSTHDYLLGSTVMEAPKASGKIKGI